MNPYIGSLIRHGLTVLSGLLLAKGIVLPPEGVDQVASGATEIVGAVISYGVAQVWSLLEKAKSKLPRF